MRTLATYLTISLKENLGLLFEIKLKEVSKNKGTVLLNYRFCPKLKSKTHKATFKKNFLNSIFLLGEKGSAKVGRKKQYL